MTNLGTWRLAATTSAALLALTSAALGQAAPMSQDGAPAAVAAPMAAANDSTEGTCVDDASQAEAATAPAPQKDGTAPGNASTGWSGGTGGSHTGTNPQGALPASTTWHAPTARGLDLEGEVETAAAETGKC